MISPTHAHAVFAEYSPQTKPMKPGMNTRVFNRTEAMADVGIALEEGTGIITLAPGVYHITGFSAVVYFTGKEPSEMVSTRSPANGGYCRLRKVDPSVSLPDDASSNETAIVVGSATTANAVPSLFETYLTVEKETQILVEHQSGHTVTDIHLQVYTENSPWHILARICIRRL
jgi:hypothetical protein